MVDPNEVAHEVLNTFNSLKSGKPSTRSNGTKEWTVLASVVAVTPESVVPLTIATGVKALPNAVRKYSQGLMVHDCHAEILALRLFNWYLLDTYKQKEHPFIEKLQGDTYGVKSRVKLALYISEPPCGDASITPEQNSEPWRKKAKFEIDGITRGRGHFDRVGVVRTKPGRNDSLVTLSKSCSDKLCAKQAVGITNTWTAALFPRGIFLDYLILPKHRTNLQDCARNFGRLHSIEHVHKLTVLTFDKDEYQYHKPRVAGVAVPSPLCLLYVVPTNTLEVLVNGVKNGSFIKNKPPKRPGASIICNQKIHEKWKMVSNHNDYVNYDEFKRSDSPRQQLKKQVRHVLGSWIPTDRDDFEF